MYMNFIVHFLEVLTLILVGVLFVRLHSCYRNFYTLNVPLPDYSSEDQASVASVRSVKVVINIPSVLEKSAVEDIAVENAVDGVEDIKLEDSIPLTLADSRAEKSIAEGSSNKQILNDYIGEFFPEPIACAQDGSSTIAAVNSSPFSEASCAQEEESAEESDEIIMVDDHYKIKPVILNDHLVIEELSMKEQASAPIEDDSIITVIEANDSSSSNNKVMSDKVVHAMLNEADLACPS